MEFYVKTNGEVRGPVDAKQLKVLAEKGYLNRNDLVRKADSEKWFRAHKVKGLFNEAVGSHHNPEAAPTAAISENQRLPRPQAEFGNEGNELPDGRAGAHSSTMGKQSSSKLAVWITAACALFVAVVVLGVVVWETVAHSRWERVLAGKTIKALDEVETDHMELIAQHEQNSAKIEELLPDTEDELAEKRII